MATSQLGSRPGDQTLELLEVVRRRVVSAGEHEAVNTGHNQGREICLSLNSRKNGRIVDILSSTYQVPLPISIAKVCTRHLKKLAEIG